MTVELIYFYFSQISLFGGIFSYAWFLWNGKVHTLCDPLYSKYSTGPCGTIKQKDKILYLHSDLIQFQ